MMWPVLLCIFAAVTLIAIQLIPVSNCHSFHSDHKLFFNYPPCPEGWFQCNDGKCIVQDLVCDGSRDCKEGDEELNCPLHITRAICGQDEYHCANSTYCIELSEKCDGDFDCPRHDDETLCPVKQCPNGFRCHDGSCLPTRLGQCDGIKDCFDGSDEIGCQDKDHKSCYEYKYHYQCHGSHKCIDIQSLCDNVTDCPNGDDEGHHCSLPEECPKYGCHHECKQTPDGPKCVCKPGYKLKYDNKSCMDIDECNEEPNPCSHICENVEGTFHCSCHKGYNLTHGGKCVVKEHEALMVFAEANDIRGYYVQSNRYFDIGKSPEHSICTIKGIDVDVKEETVYFIENCNGAGHVHSKQIQFSSDEQDIVRNGLKSPEDLAIDEIANNIYIADSGLKQIIVCQKHGIHCSVVVRDGIQKIKSIVLDLNAGYMYWSDFGKAASIYKALMDGSRVEMLVKNDTLYATGLTIDYMLNRLYWADIKLNRIEYWDFVHSKRVNFYHDHELAPERVAVFQDYIFFTSHRGRRVERMDKLTPGNKTRILDTHKVTSFHVYHPALFPDRSNPCWDSPCSHLCLLRGSGFACACPGHLELDHHRGTDCLPKPQDPFLLVSSENAINRIYFESIGRDVLVPVLSTTDTLGCIAYDWNHKKIFFFNYEKSEIISLTADESSHPEVSTKTVHALHNQTIHGLTYDSFTDNLYWLDPNNGLLEIGTTDGKSRTTLLSHLERPTDMALYNEVNKIYIANLGSDPHILVTGLDGSNPTKFISFVSTKTLPTSLFLCKLRKKLYWSDAYNGNIEAVDLIGDMNRRIILSKTSQVMSIVVHNDVLYWTTMQSSSMWYTKIGSSLVDASRIDLKLENNQPITKYILYANNEKMTSQCSRANGGCSHICLVVEGNVKCLCPPKHKLGQDNRICELEQKCAPPSFSCDHNRTCLIHDFVCDGHPDCEDQTDELDCKGFCKAIEFRCKDGACIPREWLCDRVHDCKDHSDESNCTKIENCGSSYFQCPDGKCIEKSWVCDEVADCHDGSDEKDCVSKSCKKTEFQCSDKKCITLNWHCDGESDCSDGSDELDCPKVECREGQFKCGTGACIDEKMHCDRLLDCSDGSDEADCKYSTPTCPPHLTSCNDGHCIYPEERCDGYSDCSSGEDEEDCPKRVDCPPDQVRCASPNSTVNCIPHKWLCDNANDCGDWWDETSPQCTAPAPETTTGKPCRDGSFPCTSGDCIDYDKVCDKVPNCLDQSDEGGLCDISCKFSNGNCSQICHPSPSGGKCDCKPGFKLDFNGRDCSDIDECAQIGHCSQFCENYPGGFKCTCADGYYPVSEGHKCKANGTEASLLYMLPNAIKSIGLHTQTEHSIVQINSLTMKGMDYDFKNRTVYWTDAESGTINGIHYAGGHSSRIFAGRLEKPSHLSWDYVGQNFYFINKESQIAVCNVKRVLCGVVLDTGLNKIDSFVTSSRRRIMFWSA